MNLVERELTREDIIYLLNSEGEEQNQLFIRANELKNNYFGNKVLLRGVIELSNHCRLNCLYCGMRKDNKELTRYRIDNIEKIIEIAKVIKSNGLNSISLQSGDDYSYPISTLCKIVSNIKRETGLHIILVLGERKKSDIEKLKLAGADMYILKLETVDKIAFKNLRPETSFEKRFDLLKFIKDTGYETSSGFIVGLPSQDVEDLADGILLLKEFGINNASVSPFIPSDCTPLSSLPYGNLNLTLNTLSVMRLVLGKINIPAVSAFNLLDTYGQSKALNAGANVVTINYTPPENAIDYIIYTTNRHIVKLMAAKDLLDSEGLESGLII